MTERDKLPAIGVYQVVEIVLPEAVDRLHDLAYNLWWAWNAPARRLFSLIDEAAWARYRNPVEVLHDVDEQRWETLLASDAFMEAYSSVVREFDRYMDTGRETWFRAVSGGPASDSVAYFSMEYGLHECMSIYSGGLGVLSGDHLKTASDLGIPLVGVGLLYRYGYFRQAIDADGFQQHIYPDVDFNRLPLRPALDRSGRALAVRVPTPEGEIAAKVWLAQVGRVPLLLLDTDIPENDPADRPVTGVLYVRGREMRLVQELVLGVGGAKALAALEIEPAAWHINEGHSSLLQLERMRRLCEEQGVELDAAQRRVKETTAFTTHTPVPAGNEQYDRDLARRYLEPLAARLGRPVDWVLGLGSATEGDPPPPMNLSAFALRTSRWSNGVSRLNAEVADRMWRHLFPDVPEGRPVIEAVTNGIHLPTWLGSEMRSLVDRTLGEEWGARLSASEVRARLEAIGSRDVWGAHALQKERLLRFVRSRVRRQLGRHGRSPARLRQVEGRVRSEALTIGFARRFATYKRAGLLFRDLDRLRALLANPDRPMQVLVAGKAHPADRPGQDLIRQIFLLSQEPDLLGRIVFLEDYDLRVGRKLVQGVDLWLNTPRRLMEASGTSGMKAAANGVLNCSVLDGWWPEAYDGTNGWSIGPQEIGSEGHDEDGLDASALYGLLEEEIVPLYFERDADGVPVLWADRMRRAVLTAVERFSACRMLREYYEAAYRPILSGAAADPGIALVGSRRLET